MIYEMYTKLYNKDDKSLIDYRLRTKSYEDIQEELKFLKEYPKEIGDIKYETSIKKKYFQYKI